MLLIKNGYMIDPKSGREGNFDLLIEGDRIVKIGKAGEGKTENAGKTGDWQVIDAKGLIVAPGLVDVHVHFRDPGFTHKEDIFTGARAAAKGGFTTVVLMANTKPTVDNAETLAYVLEKGKQTDIHVTTCANVTMGMQGRQITPMEELAAQGAIGFTDDGIPLMDVEIVREAMKRAKALDMPISFHEEDPALIAQNGVNRGKASAYYGIEGSPKEAEYTLIERDLKLALETGVSIDIQHISTAEGVELVRQAKKQGDNIHAEATPHHFTLTEEAVIKYGTLAKMNPPLRTEEDRLAIIRGLQDGTIEMIATDHAPHAPEEKAKPLTQAPSGIIGLETSLALGITELVKKGYLTMAQLLRLMSTNPAALYHLDAGYLAEGGPADIVLIDAEGKMVAGNYASKSVNSPFTGWELTGVVEATVCGGKVVYERGAEGLAMKQESTLLVRAYGPEDLEAMIKIWNEVVEEGIAFPQEELLDKESGTDFFAAQSYCAVAETDGEVVGLYILHPNNVGRCGHICNASYAVSSACRGQHIGERLVQDCLKKAKEIGFGVLQFNAVVESNVHARHLYERLGFVQLGTIPGGFRMKDGHYENICPYYHVL